MGRRHKGLKDLGAAKLAATVVKALLKNNKLKGDCVDELILGNAVGAGCGQNPARQAVIQAGLPTSVAGFTVNKVCGSGLKSVILGAQAIACADAQVILAGGAESVSQCPVLFLGDEKKDSLINDGLWCAFNNAHMVKVAENTAQRFKISRQKQDDYAFQSYKKAALAQKKGFFKKEIIAVQTAAGNILAVDERIRDISAEELARLPAVSKVGGSITAGNSPAPADGAAILLLSSVGAAKKFNLTPRARIIGYASSAVEPKLTFTAAAQAIKRCLKNASIRISEVDLFEIGESFAVQSILTAGELGLDMGRLNIFGGTIALGHPLGASGSRGLVTLLNALTIEKKKIGVCSICLGGGCAISLAVQLLD